MVVTPPKSSKESKKALSSRRKTKGLVIKSQFRESAISQAEATASPARVGWLEKKAQGYRYQRRFFVASGHYLRYYSKETCEELLAVVDVKGAVAEAMGSRSLKLNRDAKSFVVRCPTEADRDDWLATIQAMISRKDDLPLSPVAVGDDELAGPLAARYGGERRVRFFVAESHFLRFYHSDDPNAPMLGVIDLNSVDIRETSKGFDVSDGVSTVQLETLDDESRPASQWIDALRDIQQDPTPADGGILILEHDFQHEEDQEEDEEEDDDEEDDDDVEGGGGKNTSKDNSDDDDLLPLKTVSSSEAKDEEDVSSLVQTEDLADDDDLAIPQKKTPQQTRPQKNKKKTMMTPPPAPPASTAPRTECAAFCNFCTF
mmetsp:Transcript_2096/g.7119  ORF Transcript_2096/g.7119 Transcript_2096/m.7119 type:complete len:373 (-) Transcript_2096:384-1502(-)